MVGVGGFDRWLNENLPYLVDPDEAKQLGIMPARGLIISGVPGTGKTQLAKQMAYRWGCLNGNDEPVSFIEFNIGELSSSEYGKSEALMQKFLNRISEQAPAVLLVDEVEKTFYQNKNGNQEMHEVKKQLMGMFLGWLQEHSENVVTFMTSNDISILPPEMLRSGRLSERFFVFMPSYLELMCMLYAFIRDKSQLFCQEFNEKIEGICRAIEEHSKSYETNDEQDQRPDNGLSAKIKQGPLSHILEDLIKYAVGKEDPARVEMLNGADIKWDELLGGPECGERDMPALRTPFMTGADMKELVRRAIMLLNRKKHDQKGRWTEEDFAREMNACCCRPQFIPYGQSNMEKLVDLYLSCDYQDVSERPLLPRYQFNESGGRFDREGQYIRGTQPDNLYDQYMQVIFMREIEKAAGEKKREKDRQDRQDRLQRFQLEQTDFQKQEMEYRMEQWKEEREDKDARKEETEIRRKLQKYNWEHRK